jgi:hypothetical protein
MTAAARALTFNAVDELGFAASWGHFDEAHWPIMYCPKSLGPLIELFCLAKAGRVPDPVKARCLVPNGAAPMIAALQQEREQWVSNEERRMGFIRAQRGGPEGENHLTGFLMQAKRAAREVAGLAGKAAGQLAGAMEELENNIHEHSEAADTGLLAFRAARGVFEFVIADRGIGVLASLQKGIGLAGITDHGKALEATLTDGTSRFGVRSNRGHGFRPIFLGMVNLRGTLRFRSGDHALLMDGTSPTLATAQLAQKPVIDGFFASLRCEAEVRPSKAMVLRQRAR